MPYFAVIEERGPLVHVQVFEVEPGSTRRVALFACRAATEGIWLQQFLRTVTEVGRVCVTDG
jgi:hypothetical protein